MGTVGLQHSLAASGTAGGWAGSSTPIPATYPRIKINDMSYGQIKTINGAEPHAIINGMR